MTKHLKKHLKVKKESHKRSLMKGNNSHGVLHLLGQPTSHVHRVLDSPDLISQDPISLHDFLSEDNHSLRGCAG